MGHINPVDVAGKPRQSTAVLRGDSGRKNEKPAGLGRAHPAGPGKVVFGDLIFPKALRLVKRKGVFSPRERSA